MTFDKHDVGTWIHGQSGQKDIWSNLAAMIEDYDDGEETGALILGDDPVVSGEAVNRALGLLQADTEEGLEWVWEAGDLILRHQEGS